MWGNETQMFHFLSAFSSGEYFTSLTGLLMSKGGSCSSTVKGYHFLACAYAPKLASASTTPAATAPLATIDRFMSASCILSGSSHPAIRCTYFPKPKIIIPTEFSKCQLCQRGCTDRTRIVGNT